MTVATAKRPTPKQTARRAFESALIARAGGPVGVDREQKVIRGVKVVGLRSNNAARTIGVPSDECYSYSRAALEQAAALYENLRVNIDHPSFSYDKAGQRHPALEGRKLGDRFGRLVNVRVLEDGLYADLEYLESHPLCPMVLEAAERMPDTLALSHHAYLAPPKLGADGSVVIEKIERVESVDLIGDRPGTTISLFESEAIMDPELLEETPVDAPAEESITDAVSRPFRDKIQALLSDEAIDEAALIEKVSALITSMKAAAESVADEVIAAEEATDDDDEEPKPAAESLAVKKLSKRIAAIESENKRLRKREEARAALEAAGVPSTPVRVEALAALESAASREAFLNECKGRAALPRSRPVIESAAGSGKKSEPMSLQQTASFIRGR